MRRDDRKAVTERGSEHNENKECSEHGADGRSAAQPFDNLSDGSRRPTVARGRVAEADKSEERNQQDKTEALEQAAPHEQAESRQDAPRRRADDIPYERHKHAISTSSDIVA